jgi:hypothetical protein
VRALPSRRRLQPLTSQGGPTDEPHDRTCKTIDPGRPPSDGRALPAHDVAWTRLGSGMGYTNTATKRAAIRAAVDRMAWQDPAQLTAVLLYAAPARQVIAVLLGDRPLALHQAALAELPAGPYGRRRRLLALELVTGERWVLLDDCGYEWIHLCTDRPAREQAVRQPCPEPDR